MTLATTRASGFFRFPGRVTTRITPGSFHVRRIKDPDDPAAKTSFHLRPTEVAAPPAPAAPPPSTAPAAPAPRITVRV